jgi:competence protein ComEC
MGGTGGGPEGAAGAGARGGVGGSAGGGPEAGGSGGGVAPSDAGAPGAAGGAGAPAALGDEPLRIYWIDVEGGAATLLVAPSGETVLVDTGFGGERDAGRIAKLLQEEARASRIDHLITTHYHVDHVGGVPALAALVAIEHFYDHGESLEPSSTYDAYVKAAGQKRSTVAPGDLLRLGALEITFVTAAGKVIASPLPGGGPNAFCPSNVTKDKDGGVENAQSVGFVASFGAFTFVDLGDLTWAEEQELMCPTNRLGAADLYQVNHHGMDISNSPQLVHALAPHVAVMNNGASKGGAPAAFDVLRASPGLLDLWAMHEVPANDAAHNADPELTANLAGPDAAHFLAAVITSDGAYTLTNSRNGVSKSYASR